MTGKSKGEASGDGSELEAKAHCYWTKSIDGAMDPFVYVNYVRLQKLLMKETGMEKVVENMKAFLSHQKDLAY